MKGVVSGQRRRIGSTSTVLQPAPGKLLSQRDDALRVQDELLLLQREIEGSDVDQVRIGGCDLREPGR